MSEYLKCDAPGCDHSENVEAITADMVGRPCPKCGSNLLTEADWTMYSTVFQPAMRAMYVAGIARPASIGTAREQVLRVGYHDGEMTVRVPVGAKEVE